MEWLRRPHSGTQLGLSCVRPAPALWADLFLPCPGLCPCHWGKKAGIRCAEDMADTSGDYVGKAWGCLGEAGPSHTGPEV